MVDRPQKREAVQNDSTIDITEDTKPMGKTGERRELAAQEAWLQGEV